MQLHPTGVDPTASAKLICRATRWPVLVLLAIFWVIPLVWWSLDAPTWVLVISAAVPLLITWPLLGTWRKRGRADNWVLAVAHDGVWLNLRDCEYHEAPPGETIVFLPYHELAAARRAVHRYSTPSSDDGSTQHRDVFLEICLAKPDEGTLQEALRQESLRLLQERRYLGGLVTVLSRRTHTAVAMRGADCVRIKFWSSSYGLRPSVRRVLAELSMWIRVDEDFAERSPSWEVVDDAELDDLIRRLCANGQRMDATTLLQRRRGLTLTEAKQATDRLVLQGEDDTVEQGGASP